MRSILWVKIMIYDRNYKKFKGTTGIKPKITTSNAINSFNIPGDKYKDKRRVVTRKFR